MRVLIPCRKERTGEKGGRNREERSLEVVGGKRRRQGILRW